MLRQTVRICESKKKKRRKQREVQRRVQRRKKEEKLGGTGREGQMDGPTETTRKVKRLGIAVHTCNGSNFGLETSSKLAGMT